MKMTDMRLPKKPKKETMMDSPAMNEREEYPYGLRLDLNEDQIKKLGKLFDSSDASSEGVLHAHYKVITKRSEDRAGGKSERRLELQITSMACEPMNSGDADDEKFMEQYEESTKKK